MAAKNGNVCYTLPTDKHEKLIRNVHGEVLEPLNPVDPNHSRDAVAPDDGRQPGAAGGRWEPRGTRAAQFLAGGRYELCEFVSKGGMGAVYRAIDTELGRTVAVKCILSVDDAEARERALREARILAALEHPHILRVYDIIIEESQIWIVSEWVEGQSLGQLPFKLAPALVAAVMTQVYDALAAAHGAGVVHRDVKPGNVMVAANGRVTLIDFGVAFTRSWSSGRTMAGSLRYTAPRILEGALPDAGTDLFSAALLQLELTTGQTILPDLAPLPLYRHMTRHLEARLRSLTDGMWPPLADLATELVGGAVGVLRSGAVSRPASEDASANAGATSAAAKAAACLRIATDLSPQAYIAEVMPAFGFGDEAAQAKLREHGATVLADASLSPRQRQAWLSWLDAASGSNDNRRVEASSTNIEVSGQTDTTFNLDHVRRRGGILAHPIFSAALIAAVALPILFVATLDRGSSGGSAPREASPPIAAVPAPPPADVAAPLTIGGAINSAVGTPSGQVESEQKVAVLAGKETGERGTIAPTDAAAPRAKPDAAPEMVPVQISASAWANVLIDGKEIGRLPSAKPFSIAPGERVLRLESPLVDPLEIKINVRKGQDNRFRFRLQPRSTDRTLALTKPAGLIVNGVDYGLVTRKTLRLPFGTHEVKIRRDGEAIRTGTITIGPETPTEIRIE